MSEWSLLHWIVAIAAVWISLGMLLALGLLCGLQGYIQQTCREVSWRLDSCDRHLEQIQASVDTIEDDVRSLEAHTVENCEESFES